MLIEVPKPTDELDLFKRRVCLAISRLATSKLGQSASPEFAGLTIGGGAISPTLIGQWNTAYGWGDHAGLYDPVGSAADEVGDHETAYDHTLLHSPVTIPASPNGLSLTGQEISLPTTAGPTFASLILSSTSVNPERNPSFRPVSTVADMSQLYCYPAAGTNVASAFGIVPRGTGLSNNRAQLTVFGTDYIADTANYEFLSFRARNNDFAIFTGKAGSGTQKPLYFSADNLSTVHLTIATTGRVGINESDPDYKLDVNGTFGFTPGASVTPVDNGDVVIEATNNTTLTFKLKGSDGTVRSGTITLA